MAYLPEAPEKLSKIDYSNVFVVVGVYYVCKNII